MPLVPGKSKEAIMENIRRLISEGRPASQASAIAYSNAGLSKKKSKKKK